MSYPKYSTLKVETKDHVALVMISRPEAHNAWTKDVCLELIDVYERLENDANIRVIVLTGDPAGKVFCAGADLSVADFSNDRQSETEVRDGGGIFTLTVYRSRKITIAAINGSAAGIGVTQTLPMDLRFAWAGAKIAFPFIRRGIVPEAASTYFLPQLIGRSRALAIVMQGTPVLASSPLFSGLFAELLPNKDEVLPYALRVAHELASNTSPASVAYTKSLIFNARGTPEEQHLLDSRAMYILGNGHDSKEGVKAFLEKRKAKFQNFPTYGVPDWLQPSAKTENTAGGSPGLSKSKL